MIKKCAWVFMQSACRFYNILMKIKFFLIFLAKNTHISHFVKIHPVRSELFQAVRGTDGRTDGETDRQTNDEANSLFSQFCERT